MSSDPRGPRPDPPEEPTLRALLGALHSELCSPAVLSADQHRTNAACWRALGAFNKTQRRLQALADQELTVARVEAARMKRGAPVESPVNVIIGGTP